MNQRWICIGSSFPHTNYKNLSDKAQQDTKKYNYNDQVMSKTSKTFVNTCFKISRTALTISSEHKWQVDIHKTHG